MFEIDSGLSYFNIKSGSSSPPKTNCVSSHVFLTPRFKMKYTECAPRARCSPCVTVFSYVCCEGGKNTPTVPSEASDGTNIRNNCEHTSTDTQECTSHGAEIPVASFLIAHSLPLRHSLNSRAFRCASGDTSSSLSPPSPILPRSFQPPRRLYEFTDTLS